jgi:hypothetical protein
MITLDEEKTRLRWKHCRADSALITLSSPSMPIGRRLIGMDAYHAACDAARKFWSIYERLNRQFRPDDPVYSVVRSGFTPAANADMVTFQTPASRKWRLLEIMLGSEGTASATARQAWQVSTGGTTETAGNAPEKFDIDSPSSMFTTAEIVFNWSTHPTLSGQPKLNFAYNALGGYYDYKLAPGAEVYHRNSEQVSYRNIAGTAVLSFTVIEEEL